MSDTEKPFNAYTMRNDIARDLREILKLYAALPDEYEHRSLGKDIANIDALDLHGPAANLEAWEHRYEAAEAAGGPDYAADQVGTEVHPELVLASIESDIREARDQPTDLTSNVERSEALIRNSLDWMFDPTQHEDGVWVYAVATAHKIRRVVTNLENAVMDGERHEWVEVECLACGEKLCRRMGKRKEGPPDSDRGGIEDNYWCHGCFRHLAPAEYNLARKQHAINDLLADIQ